MISRKAWGGSKGYGLICVPPRFLRRVGPNPIGLASLEEEEETPEKRPHEETRKKTAICKPKREATGETKPHLLQNIGVFLSEPPS